MTTKKKGAGGETRSSKTTRRPVEAPMQRTAADGTERISAEDRGRMIAERAYYLAAARGFAAGGELDDWVAAEREIDATIATDDTVN